ncbi:MAG: family hydrolase, diadenosine tetraphosphate hydrolase [Acidimicrobiia bacterium]|nr:family hydrolase, diadenosine tetraphosphate hydrolase [Acidimicrobiia bacterium]
MPTLFTRIITGEIPGTFVWRDEQAVAFLSIAPATPGHTLVVPIAEVDHWIDLAPALAGHLMQVAQWIGRAQQQAFRPERIGLIVAGFEVPHTHLHVIPMDTMGDLALPAPSPDPDFEALAAAAVEIRRQLQALGAPGVSE